jgi:hypothetical protein
MKLPRWLVILMLTTSVLSVLATAGWWWVTWPERTAREFMRKLSEQNISEGDELSWLSIQQRAEPRKRLDTPLEETLELPPRPLGDVLRGRQPFELRCVGFKFVVQRGKLIAPDGFIVVYGQDNAVRMINPAKSYPTASTAR